MVAEKVTYGELDKLLTHLGFVSRKGKLDCRVYEHKKSNTIIVLNDKSPTELARPSEILSARIHLVQKGLIAEGELDNYLANGNVNLGAASGL